MVVIIALIVLVLTILMCLQESKKRKITFWKAFIICLLISPFFGYFIITNHGLRNPAGCKWCGNEKNEAEFCGICGKNVEGILKNK